MELWGADLKEELRRGYVKQNECIQIVSAGQIAGIAINPDSNLDIDWALQQQSYHLENTGLLLPIFEMPNPKECKSNGDFKLFSSTELDAKRSSPENIKFLFRVVSAGEADWFKNDSDKKYFEQKSKLAILKYYND